MKKILYLFILFFILGSGILLTAKSTSALITPSRLIGKILLQVESKGEAWYVSPVDGKRYSMGRPVDAFNLMRELGIGITNVNLRKIQIANENLIGQDSDGDGLSDMVEDSIGTDKNNSDSDADGYNDKDEIMGGYNPSGSGKLNLDNNFAKSQAGKILLQVEQHGEAWYVNPDNYQRYFMGRPVDAFNLMRKLGLGISNNDLNKITQASGQGTNQTCVESWTCGSWSICQSNQQTRSCSDSKNCGTTNNKPPTSQSCTIATATCSAQGGENCSAANKECIGNKVNASDTSVCCLTGCVIKSCSAQAGNKCSFSGSCSSGFFTAGDTDRCCKNACTVCSVAGYTKSDGLPGVVCGQGQRCASGGVAADDGILCCSNNCVPDTTGAQNTCSLLGGAICGQNQICSRTGGYSPGDELDPGFLYNTQAADTSACCDISHAQTSFAAGCVSGDVSIAGPAAQVQFAGSNRLDIQNFVTSYTKDGQPWEIANIPANVYIDGQLVKSGIVWGYPGTEVSSNLSVFDNGTYTLRYFDLGDVKGKTVRIVLDPDNKVIEINNNNNVFEGVVR